MFSTMWQDFVIEHNFDEWSVFWGRSKSPPPTNLREEFPSRPCRGCEVIKMQAPSGPRGLAQVTFDTAVKLGTKNPKGLIKVL